MISLIIPYFAFAGRMQRDLRGLGGRRLHAELPSRRGQHEAGRQTARYAVGRSVPLILVINFVSG